MAENTFDPSKGYWTAFTSDDYDKFNDELRGLMMKVTDAASRHAGANVAREQLKNYLFNYADLILSLSGEFNHVRQLLIEQDEELDSVRVAIANADKEYNELNRKYKALVAESGTTEAPKKTSKKKTEVTQP